MVNNDRFNFFVALKLLKTLKFQTTLSTSMVDIKISFTVAVSIGAFKISAIPFCFLEYKSKLALKFHQLVGL